MKNATLIAAAKKILKDLLAQCTEDNHLVFKRMYAHKHLDWDINKCVDNMEVEKIDWAISQTEYTIKKNTKNLAEAE